MLVFFTDNLSAQEIMDKDKKLLDELDSYREPILHFYKWPCDSISYGYFVDPGKFLNLSEVEKAGIQLARRPTGGGIVFHLWDMAFSFLLPSDNKHFSLNTLDNYKFVNSIVLSAVKEFLSKNELSLIEYDFPAIEKVGMRFCMATPTKYDVLIGNKKIAGAAQRKTKKGFLHQGTIALHMPKETILKKLLLEKNSLKAMLSNTFALFEPGIKGDEKLLKSLLIRNFEKSL